MRSKSLLLALTLVSALAIQALRAEPVPPTPAPSWTLKDVNGQDISSAQFAGKVMVVDFWATWCGPCRVEIPGYIALQKKYGKDRLAIIGVSVDQGPEVVKKFIQANGVDYQIVMADDEVVQAFGGEEGINAIPTTFIIDREGRIRDRKLGAEETEEFEQRLATYLK